jgi:hypothetical protein
MKMTLTLSIDGCNVEKSVLLPMRYGINAGGISKEDMTEDNGFDGVERQKWDDEEGLNFMKDSYRIRA